MQRTDLRSIWPVPRPIAAMVHLMPLPGSPGWAGSMQAVLDRKLHDATCLAAAGFDGLIVGSGIKQAGHTTAPVDPERARRLLDPAPRHCPPLNGPD